MRYSLFVCLFCLAQLQLTGQLEVQFTVAENQNCNGIGCNYDGPSILINEIMLAPGDGGDGSIFGLPFEATSGNQGEWIEIYNPDVCKSIDVSCYYLGNNTYSYDQEGELGYFGGGLRIPNGTVVPPMGFLLVRGPNAPPVPDSLLVSNGGNTLELVVDSSMVCIESNTRLWFPNSGGWFAFYDRSGEPQDAVSWVNGDGSLYKPCVASTSNCTPVDSLASYVEIAENRKNYITDNIIDFKEFSFQRIPDGREWMVGVGLKPTYGTCNDVCGPNKELNCTGSISLEINGGVPPYEILWDDSRAQRTSTALNLCAGRYCAVITDAEGNQEQVCGTVTDFEPSISIKDPGVICDTEDTVQLQITPPIGSEDSIHFEGIAVGSKGAFLPQTAGEGVHSVSCYYETKFGCATTANLDIRVAEELPLELHILDDGVREDTVRFCEAQGPAQLVLEGVESAQNDFTITYVAEESDSIQSYPTITLDEENNTFEFDTVPGSYTLSITEVAFDGEFLCATDINPVHIIINPIPTITANIAENQVCQGETVPITASFLGNPQFQFEVSELTGKDDSLYTFSGEGTVTANLQPTEPGQHQYQLSGLADGSSPTCLSDTVINFDVDVIESPFASLNGSGTWCAGDFFEARVSVSGNANVMLTYRIGNTLDSVLVSPPEVIIRDSLGAGNYVLELVSAKSNSTSACSGIAQGSFDIRIQEKPVANAFFTPNPMCEGDPVDFNMVITGNGPFEIDFTSDNQQPQTITTTSNFQIKETARQGLKYTILEIRDDSQALQNGGTLGPCVSTLNLDVIADVNKLPSISFQVSEDTICQGESIDLTFSASDAEPFDLQYRLGDTDIERSSIAASYTETVTPTDSTTVISITQLTDNNGCSPNALPASILVVVNPNPSPNVSATTRNSCIPLNTQLRFQEGIVPLSDAIYRAGNQRAAGTNGESDWTLSTAGTYDLTGTLVSTEACTTSFRYPDYFEVYPFPKADFSVYPPVISEEIQGIQFSDASSQEAQSWQWQFSIGAEILSESEKQNPRINPELSRYDTLNVQLITSSAFDCRDTTSRQFIIEPPIAIYVPSAVTANQDQLNDAFAIAISNSGLLQEFKFQIFNRWGDLVETFRNTDFEWNPDQHQGGEIENGLYVWRMEYRLHGNAQSNNLQGVIHVLR